MGSTRQPPREFYRLRQITQELNRAVALQDYGLAARIARIVAPALQVCMAESQNAGPDAEMRLLAAEAHEHLSAAVAALERRRDETHRRLQALRRGRSMLRRAARGAPMPPLLNREL